MVVAELPTKYPQTICGAVGCNKRLKEPNNKIMTSKLCPKCADLFFKNGNIYNDTR